MNKKKDTRVVAFGASTKDDVSSNDKKPIDAKMLVKSGILPELIGRLPIIVELQDLTENDLKRILVEPENSIVKQYTDLVGLDGVDLKFSEDVLSFIAKKAFDNKTGARGLKSIIEGAMNDLMFELPDMVDVTEVEAVLEGDLITFKYSSSEEDVA